jgi:hypothetical protein
MKRFKKPFWVTLFWHQNKYHKHGTILHTLKVAYHLARKGRWDLVPAGLLHDIAKPLTAYQDEDDIKEGGFDYSFTHHEIFGWHIIKNWKISDYTKNIVRYHYLIRGMHKARTKGEKAKLRRLKRIWNKLDNDFKNDLAVFLVADDKGKK